jgi:riboflavin kinase/FMN adenylyltransferase
MKIFRSFEEAKNINNPVVTTGLFDGVHIGHKAILNRLRMLAEKYNGESVLITFDPHPRKVLYPETAGKDLKLINSQEEKLDLLEKAGLENVIIVEFTREFSKITSEQFVRDLLHRILHAKVIVAGFNHHFGFNKEGDYKQLWKWQTKYHFEAEEIPEQEVYHETVSSTKIRQAISEGYIQRANAYLDHYYIIKGKPENYPIENSPDLPVLVQIPLTEECKILPSLGIYAVSAEAGSFNSKGNAKNQRNPDNT